MRKALQAEQGKADMERKVCHRVLVLHNLSTLQWNLKLQWKCSSQFWLHLKYKGHFESTMIFSNYLLASGRIHVNLVLSLLLFIYLFTFFLHKLRIQVPISRNMLKCLNLDKLKHDITCKSYTKDNSKVRFTWSNSQMAIFENIMVFFKWPITFNEPLNK